MRGNALKLAALMILGSATIMGCSTSKPVVVTPTGQVVVTQEPPPPKQEVIGTAPGASYIWVQGYWMHTDGRWVWVPGHWQARPTVTAIWVPGHWDRTPNGWVWTPGRWQ
jgi:YXWGXW repeat-containing protein